MLRQISFNSANPVKEPNNDENKESQNDRFAQNFMANMKLFFEEAKQGSVDFLSDFTLKSAIDGKENKAHKIILASQSKYFRGLFRNNPNTSSVSLDHEHLVIEACIEGIYTGTTPLSFDTVQDILIAADYLGVDDLVKQASNFIILNMDDSNCYDILIFGCDQGHDKMASSAASYIGRGLCDVADENSEDLYALPSNMFLKVLESNGVIIKEKKSGMIMTGLARELLIIPLIEKYLSIHPENKFEDFVSCCRLDGFDYRNVGKYELVKQTLLIVLNTNLERGEKVNAVNRATQMSHEMDDKPAKDVPMYGEEIVDICQQLSEEMKKRLISYAETDQQSLRSSLSLKHRKWNKSATQFTKAYGRAPDHTFDSNSLHQYNKIVGNIKKIVVHTRIWDSRNIVKGMEICLLGNDQVIKFGLDDGPGNAREEFDLGKDEYIAYVEGRSGWYLDQLTFVTNKNRKLGPVGGTGGDAFSTLQHTKYNELASLQQLANTTKNVSCHVRGLEVSKVHTQDLDTIARVRFLVCLIHDKELTDDSAELMDVDYDDYDNFMNYMHDHQNGETSSEDSEYVTEEEDDDE